MGERRPLHDLEPSWLSTSQRRIGMGVKFRCPMAEHPGEWIEVWFINPVDGGDPATLTPDRTIRSRMNSNLDNLCLFGPIEHGDVVLIVYDGLVNLVALGPKP